MKYIMGPRQSGKTTRLVEATIIKKGILLVATFMMVQRIEKLYPLMKNKVFTWDYFESHKGDYKDCPVYVDDVGFYLQQKFGHNFKGASMLIGDLWEDTIIGDN
ncbi:MAG: hypothetical protein HQ594_04625 [Candidatus Omnitrophica bacterium]|nr:hypothetical protein [Candidatus Omnitrophota bacterium]